MQRAPAPCNVIFISIDTLRADRLGAYGGEKLLTPHLDALAGESVVFTDSVANSSNTLVSHASLFTSLYPFTHAVRPGKPLPERAPTLNEILKGQGYATAFFAAHGDWLTPEYGFARGVDHFRSAYVGADEIDRQARGWIAGRSRADAKPFFLFLHYYDVHSEFRAESRLPYECPEPWSGTFTGAYSRPWSGEGYDGSPSEYLRSFGLEGKTMDEEELAYVRGLYDEGVLYTDFMVGRFLEHLRQLDLYDDALIVVTSDHGEAFLEHGHFLHGRCYEEVVRVPLLIRFPGGIPYGTCGGMAEGVDVLPTLLDYLGIPAPDPIQGESLLPRVEGEPSGKPFTISTNLVLRNRSWKGFLSARKTLLFDLANDPAELHDVADRNPRIVEQMTEFGASSLARGREIRNRHLGGEDRKVEEDAATRKRLQALGYAE